MYRDKAKKFQVARAVVLIIKSHDNDLIALTISLSSKGYVKAEFLHPGMIGGISIFIYCQHRRT